MKSDPEYWADVAKFQKETEDLKKEKKETYAEFRDAPDSDDDSESEDMSEDSDDDSESEDMSTNEESIPTRSFKRHKKEDGAMSLDQTKPSSEDLSDEEMSEKGSLSKLPSGGFRTQAAGGNTDIQGQLKSPPEDSSSLGAEKPLSTTQAELFDLTKDDDVDETNPKKGKTAEPDESVEDDKAAKLENLPTKNAKGSTQRTRTIMTLHPISKSEANALMGHGDTEQTKFEDGYVFDYSTPRDTIVLELTPNGNQSVTLGRNNTTFPSQPSESERRTVCALSRKLCRVSLTENSCGRVTIMSEQENHYVYLNGHQVTTEKDLRHGNVLSLFGPIGFAYSVEIKTLSVE